MRLWWNLKDVSARVGEALWPRPALYSQTVTYHDGEDVCTELPGRPTAEMIERLALRHSVGAAL